MQNVSELRAEVDRLTVALEASEQRLRNVISKAADGIMVVDASGIVRLANPAAERMFAKNASLLGSHFGIPLAGGGVAEIEIPAEGAGEPRTAGMRVVETEWAGRKAWVATLRDITERKRAEEALRRSEERYRQIFMQDITGDYISTPEGKFLDCNAAFVRIFGFESREQALATPAVNLYPDPQQREAFVELVRANKKLESHQVELRRIDGKAVHAIENVYGTFDERGNLVTITGYLIDLTEQKSLEQQLRHAQRMEAVGRLAGGVAHDFNNLLTVITGYGQMLLETMQQGDPIRPDLEEILRAADRASALTNRLLVFSRRQNMQPKIVDLNLLLADAHKMLKRVIGEDIDLMVIPGHDLGVVRVDPSQIEQVIMNLAVNARDAMPGGGKLTIETANIELDEDYARGHLGVRAGRYVMLAVSDTGHGMSAEVQQHLFEPFFTTKEQGKGTGLGLSIVYGIVKQSGGEITVYSEVDRGSTFKIYLPRVDARTEPSAPDVSAPEAFRGTETVLLVEDEEGVRKLIREVLQKQGYRVLVAANPSEAMALSARHAGPIHLLLTDVIMPAMNGRDLSAEILRTRPDMKVLYVSGYTDNAVIHHGMLEPGMAFLQKPFAPSALGRKVREILEEEPTRSER